MPLCPDAASILRERLLESIEVKRRTLEKCAPQILDAGPWAQVAQQVVSAPLTLTLPQPQPGDPGPWYLPADQLAAMPACCLT